MFHKADLLLVALLLFFAVAPFTGLASKGEAAGRARIYYQNRLIKEIDLKTAQPETFRLEEIGDFVLRITNQRSIGIVEAPCPDQICVRTKEKSHPGELIVCVPEELVIELLPDSEQTAGDEAPEQDLIIGEAREE